MPRPAPLGAGRAASAGRVAAVSDTPSTPEIPAGTVAWLAPSVSVERVELDDRSWIDVVRGLVPDGTRVHDELVEQASWSQGRVFRYERWKDEPRLQAGQRGADRHPALVEVQDWLEARYAVDFGAVALARYRHGRDSVAWHRDREMTWLEDTLIGVLSLGQRRPFLVRPLDGRRADDEDLDDAVDLRPGSGDLLVMGGRCQLAWLHAVPKVHGPCGSRISAQWRWTSRRGRPDTNPSYFAPRRYGAPGSGIRR